MEVTLNATEFHSGDTMMLSIAMSNMSGSTHSVDAWLILRVGIAYYFYRYDTTGFPPVLNMGSEAGPLISFPFFPDTTIPATQIWQMTFPDMTLVEPIECAYYFALLNSANSNLVSNISVFSFLIDE